jgi:hypothetical protein
MLEAGNRSSLFAGLIGRDSSPAPQFGQRPSSLVSTRSERAFKAANHCIRPVLWEILVAAFAVRPKLKHLYSPLDV